MTSDKRMKEILSEMPDEPISMPELCQRLERYDSNVRRDLTAMLELGLVRKVAIDKGGRKLRGRRVGWEKTHPI